ncbi:hypothetical protein QE450_004318 [Paenibacillus sp. SORGH_AS306]|nr:hypothetical protein [Paenibacillus sp. SORGH_AS_0306]MDR6109181.1 hypothetical protein [Paenibacillus sp. SORGH_AS_0338]
MNPDEIVIVDTVAEEFSKDLSTTYFQLNVEEMLYIMDEIDKWKTGF